MIDDPTTAIAVMVLASAACQLLGARLQVPSVVPLLAAGLALGTVIDPDELFGDLLFDAVGIGVAILLFEGGTGLNWRQLTAGRSTVVGLVTIGAAVAWAVATFTVLLVLDIETELGVLIGAILVVSGPTVVIPLLRVVRPREPTGSILRWEGILIDPVGAGLAIVVLDAILEDRSAGRIVLRVLATFGAGAAVGLAVSAIVLFAMGRRSVPDHLQIPAVLTAVVTSYAFANEIRPEAGLVAVTLVGMAFANQRRVPAAHIVRFSEGLGTSVLGVLFVLLGARVEIDSVVDYLPQSIAIVAALVLVARPLSVLSATVGSGLPWRDRGFLMVLAPRGVVAAAVASLFALELEIHGIDPGPLVPVVFSVVVGTVIIASVTARFAARRLRVAQAKPQGVAIVGGGTLAFELADLLLAGGVSTLHVGLDDDDAAEAASRGQLVFTSSVDSDDFELALQGAGMAHAVALSGGDRPALVLERIAHVIGGDRVFSVDVTDSDSAGTSRTVRPRPILPEEFDAARIDELCDDGATLRRTEVDPTATAAFDEADDGWLTVCRIDPQGQVSFAPSGTATDGSLIQFGPVVPSSR